MKKNILFVLIIVFVLGVFAFNYQRLVSFFEHHAESILARVNGEPISLEEVEKLYDMRNVHLNSPAPDVERVQKEYAEILYNRIIQVLISQELKKRNAAVSQEEVTAYENKIKKSYGELLEQQRFEDYLAEYGIDYQEWLKQLKAQVENDALHTLLQKEISLTTEETIQYAEKIKEQQNMLCLKKVFPAKILSIIMKKKVRWCTRRFLTATVCPMNINLFCFPWASIRFLLFSMTERPIIFCIWSSLKIQNKMMRLIYIYLPRNVWCRKNCRRSMLTGWQKQ